MIQILCRLASIVAAIRFLSCVPRFFQQPRLIADIPTGVQKRPLCPGRLRLRDGQLPSRPARQLPDLPTTLWVDPPSTGVPRLRGAPSAVGYKPKFATPRQLVCSSPESRLARSAYALATAQCRLLPTHAGTCSASSGGSATTAGAACRHLRSADGVASPRPPARRGWR